MSAPMNAYRNRATAPWFLVILICLSLLAVPAIVEGQDVTGISGETVTLSVGSMDGVRVGMTGDITKQETVSDSQIELSIARFEVTAVNAGSCTAKLTAVGAGFSVTVGLTVRFDQELRATPTDKAVIVIRSNVANDVAYLDGKRLGPTPQSVEVDYSKHIVRVEKDGYSPFEKAVTPSKTEPNVVYAVFERQADNPAELARAADTAFEARDWARAAILYDSLAMLVPNDQIAKDRASEAKTLARQEAKYSALKEEVEKRLPQASYYLEQGEAAYRRGDFDDAARYFKTVAHVSPDYYLAADKYALSAAQVSVRLHDWESAGNLLADVDAAALPSEFQEDADYLLSRIAGVKAEEESRRSGEEERANKWPTLIIKARVTTEYGKIIRTRLRQTGYSTNVHKVSIDGKQVGEFRTPVDDFSGQEVVFRGDLSPGRHLITYQRGWEHYGRFKTLGYPESKEVDVQKDPTIVVIDHRDMENTAFNMGPTSTTIRVE